MTHENDSGHPPGPEAPPYASRMTDQVYGELRALAASCLRNERPGHTLQPTALVNEAFLRLFPEGSADSMSREEFLAIAARAMRQVLVDHARRHNAQKRGGHWQRLSLSDIVENAEDRIDLVALDTALDRLGTVDPRMAQIVELQYFGGLTGEEAARTLDISRSTVKRELGVARTWLLREIDRITADIA